MVDPSYVAGDFVTYQGMTFQATTDIAPGGINPFYDGLGTNLKRAENADPVWQRMDGHWAKVDSTVSPCPDPSFTYTRFDADGNREVNPDDLTDTDFGYDMKVTMYDGTTKITSLNYDDTNVTADAVTCFAARGNFLNWASASKFDIQKEILTGGKYSAGYEDPLIVDPDEDPDSDYDGPLEVGFDDDGVPFPDNEETGDADDDRLIAESRGCSGSNYIKQVRLWDPSTTTGTPTGVEPPNNDSSETTLTMRVRGPLKEDWISTGEDVTRIEIMGVSGNTFDATSCESAVEAMVELAETGQGGVGFISDTDKCLTNTNKDLEFNPALNHALQYCGFSWRTNAKEVARNLNPIIGECATYYEEFAAGAIDPYDDAYVCYGIFDDDLNHDKRDGFDLARAGYIGRCWEKAAGVGGTMCENIAIPSDPACTDADDPCEFWYDHDSDTSTDDILVRNRSDFIYTEYCTNLHTSGTRCQNANSWEEYTVDSVSELQCDPNDPIYTGGGTDPGWSSILYPNDADPDALTADQQAIAELSNRNAGATGLTDPAWWCIFQGMEDYCADTSVPEVIDPSDLASDSGSTYNLPATLIDSGVVAQLGTDRPLATFKGFIKYDLPDNHDSDPGNTNADGEFEGDSAYRPDGPRNVLFDVAERYDLRLGVMAFNEVGSSTECDYLKTTCTTGSDGSFTACADGTYDADECEYCTNSLNMDKYCPEYGLNRDGARVISQIARSMVGDAQDPLDLNDDTEDWSHYVELTKAINDTKATSWTPLSEAVFAALGYYGQNTAMRINSAEAQTACEKTSGDEFKVCAVGTGTYDEVLCDYCNSFSDFYTNAEDPDNWEDPVQYWCQENNILIITEGASTADTFDTTAFSGFQGDDDGTEFTDSVCPGGLEGSTYLDDLTYFGQNATVEGASPDASNLFTELLPKDETNTDYAKRPVSTYIITTGSQDTSQTEECAPWGLMNNAASNGGTELLWGEDPDDVKSRLQEAFAGIANRASAGSAASVISSSRSGEGAVYQAVFWPEIPRGELEDPLTWVGDVHALFIDNKGQLWDDYDGNGTLDSAYDGDLSTAADACPAGDRRLFYNFIEAENTTKICFIDPAIDPECDDWTGCSKFDPIDIRLFDSYLWSIEGSLESVDNLEQNRSRNADGTWNWTIDGETRRYIFTWNDLNNDGIAQSDEIYQFEKSVASISPNLSVEVNWSILNPVDTTDSHHDVLDDFRVSSSTEMDELVDWIRGIDVLEPLTTGNNFDDRNDNGIRDYIYRCRKYGAQGATYPGCYVFDDATGEPTAITDNNEWRLGDVVHSTPKLVSQPAEAFHTIYRDPSYAEFVQRWRYRRSMIYFGANDGMLHAVNGGFYDTNSNKFWTNLDGILSESRCYYDATGSYPEPTDPDDPTTGCSYNLSADGPPLGTEMWAYLPYNLQPHLLPLTGLDYGSGYHEYYVDKEPRIFDMKIFEEEGACTYNPALPDTTGPASEGCIHPGGWGTVLIGAMRYGGHPITAADHADDPLTLDVDEGWEATDNRQFISSYFALDITNPEGSPTLLGELTRTIDNECYIGDVNVSDDDAACADMGFSVPMVTGAVMRDVVGTDSNRSEQSYWYLILGSGPASTEGENTITGQGKIAVMPLNWLFDDSTTDADDRRAFRIPDHDPPAADDFNAGGIFPIEERAIWSDSDTTILGTDLPSFTSDLITVDYDVETRADPEFGALYKSDAIYFGTTDGYRFIGDTGSTSWSGGGRVFRLVTRSLNAGVQEPSPPSDWYLAPLLDAQSPVTGAPSIGWDGANYWIYFGTGRFYSVLDKTDATTNYFFGVKEPVDDTCEMTWNEITWLDSVGSPKLPDPDGNASFGDGARGLFRTDNIDVLLGKDYADPNDPTAIYRSVFNSAGDPIVFCEELPEGEEYVSGECDLNLVEPSNASGFYSFKDLRTYIAGDARSGTTTPCAFSDDTGIEGWYRVLPEPRERVVGQSTLLGGLVTFTSYQPEDDVCTPEGQSWLNGVHYQAGTAWYESVFGIEGGYTYEGGETPVDTGIVRDRISIGQGLATTPSLHTGSESEADAKAFIQTSTGAIIEIEQENLPIKPPRSGRVFWSDDRNPEFKYGEESENP